MRIVNVMTANRPLQGSAAGSRDTSTEVLQGPSYAFHTAWIDRLPNYEGTQALLRVFHSDNKEWT